MRKKFFAMYALVGALVASPVFTSCVDDSESASVTAIRNAKAEQLKASAAYSLAQAEYQKAQAAYYNALAEQEANETEESKQEFAYKIESLKAQYEASVLNYEMKKMEYLSAMKDYENEALVKTAAFYSQALDKSNELNAKLTEAKMKLAQVGIDSAKNVALLENHVAEQNQIIANATAQIERINAYKGESLDELKMKLENLKDNYKALKKEQVLASDAATKANTTYSDAKTAYNNNLEYVKAITALQAIAAPYAFTITPETDNYDVYITSGLTPTLTPTSYTKSYSAVLESEVLAYTQHLNDALKTAKDNLGTPKDGDKAATKAYDILEALEAAVKAAKDGMALETPTHDQDDVDAAELLLAQYKDDVTPRDFDGDATNGNEQSLAYLQNAVKIAEKNITNFEALIAAVTEGSDEHKEWVAAQEALLAAAEAYNEAYDKHSEISKKVTATGITSITINGNNEEVINPTIPTTGEYAILYTLINNTGNTAALIAEQKAIIAEAKAEIEEGLEGTSFSYELTNVEIEISWDGNRYVQIFTEQYTTKNLTGVSNEDLKALYEKVIANLEAKLAVQEEVVAKYKAELDALLTEEA